jgi:DNA-binding GntR family transcriptional regulator
MSGRTLDRKTTAKPPIKLAKPMSLREQIYENLRDRIRAGELSFEDRLVDVDIADQFGVSRMPVREALMQLVHDGMIESTTRGFVLRRFSDQEVKEIFEIRRLLEPAAAAGAARNMTDEVLATLEEALAECERTHESGEAAVFIRANARFRGAWLAQVPNGQLADAILRYMDHAQVVRLETLPIPAVRADVIGRMREIFNAFRERDAEKAARLIEKHVDAALAFFLRGETPQ